MGASDRVTVRRLAVRCLAPAEHPDPLRVRDRVAEVARSALPAALRRGLAPLMAGREGLWFVRRLELDLTLDVAQDTDDMANAWAQGVARALRAALDGADGADVVRFPDREEHLARFLVAAAAGRAWNRWYFAAFEGLKLLPAAAALRTAIVEDAARGAEALARLSPREAAAVVGTLGRSESVRVLEALAEGPCACDAAAACEAVVSALEGEAALPDDDATATLTLFVAARRADRAASGAPLRRACGAAVGLLRDGDTGVGLTAGDGPAPATDTLAATGFTAAQVARLAALATPSPARAPAASAAPTVQRTRFGGTFLLLPHLARLPIDRLCAGWPGHAGVHAPAIVRALVLGAALGGRAPWAAFDDALVRGLAGLEADWDESATRRWQAGVTRTMCADFVAELAEWRRECGDAPGNVLALVRARAPGGECALVADGERGYWLHAAPLVGGRLGDEALAALARVAEGGGVLVADDALAPQVPADAFASVLRPADADLDALPARDTLFDAQDRVEEDLALLTVPARHRLAGRLRRVVAVAAQGVLRDVAWRLPGFAFGHVAHLRANFLAFDAKIEDAPARRVVRLGRPPLDLVLAMTGAKRREYTLAWLDDRPFALYPEP